MSKTATISFFGNSRSRPTVLRFGLMALLPAMVFGACRPQPQAVEKATSPTPQSSIASNPSPTVQTSMTNPPGFPSPILNHPYPGTGGVTIINRKEGWIEIDHEDIEGLMPAMQMEFWVKNRSLLDRVKAGDRVDFVVVEMAKGEYLTQITKKK